MTLIHVCYVGTKKPFITQPIHATLTRSFHNFFAICSYSSKMLRFRSQMCCPSNLIFACDYSTALSWLYQFFLHQSYLLAINLFVYMRLSCVWSCHFGSKYLFHPTPCNTFLDLFVITLAKFTRTVELGFGGLM